MSAQEQFIEMVFETTDERITTGPKAIGNLAMPDEAKQTYAYMHEDSGQLVIEQYANNFDQTPIAID